MGPAEANPFPGRGGDRTLAEGLAEVFREVIYTIFFRSPSSRLKGRAECGSATGGELSPRPLDSL